MKRLAGAAHQQQRTHLPLDAMVQPGRMRSPGVVASAAMGTSPMSAAPEARRVGALGGQHPVNLIARGERGIKRRMLEVPHQRGGIEEADGGNAQAGWGREIHLLLDYSRKRNNAGGAWGMNLRRQWARPLTVLTFAMKEANVGKITKECRLCFPMRKIDLCRFLDTQIRR